MAKEREQPDEVRIVDRRRFTEQGERREGVEAEPVAPPPPPGPAPSATATPPKAAEETTEARHARQTYERKAGLSRREKIDLETLILSLSTSAMLQLGLIQDPGGATLPVDPEAARQTIDMLGVIEEKTRGNLSASEKQLLDQVLYELRLAYVQVTSGAPRGGKLSGRS